MLDEETLDGFDVKDLKCIACSPMGNCGYKWMYLKPEGGVQSICLKRRKMAQCARDGIEYNDELLKQ